MPSIYYLNPPPNPFWDFVASMEDHPLVTGGGPSRRSDQPGPPFFHRQPAPPTQPETTTPAQENEKNEATAASAESSEKGKGKQAYVDEDPPEVDPSTVKPAPAPAAAAEPADAEPKTQSGYPDFPTWGYDMIFGNRNNEGQEGAEGPRHRGCRGGRGFGSPRGHRGPPPFMMGPGAHGPPWARRGPPGPPGAEHEGPGAHGPPWARRGPSGGEHEHEGPGPRGPWWARRGPPPPPAGDENQPEGPGPHHHRRGGPGGWGCGRGARHAHGNGPRGCSPPAAQQSTPSSNFNLGDFLNNLGQRLGVDLSVASEALGTTPFTAPRNTNTESDFEPRADIFDTPESYLIHLSLPGAKKEDVGVDWDGENSILRIAGVVHRPGVDEQLMAQLVVDGRKRETGVFERAVRLGTRRDPASIDVAGITAKMTDGVLVVKVPKVEPKHEKREVPISASSSNSGSGSPARGATVSAAGTQQPNNNDGNNEKQRDLLFDADDEMLDVPTTTTALPHRTPHSEKETEMEVEHENEKNRDDRSETLDHEHEKEEQLPKYEGEGEHFSDWERYGSDDEGDFVKITVN